MGKTTIEWCDHSVNPIRARWNGHTGHHCIKISPGCSNCYASRLQARFQMPPYQTNRRTDVEMFLDPKALEEVRNRRTPTRYFWCDMCDMFLEGVPREWWKAIMGVWMDTPQHTHMVLTKRPVAMRDYFRDDRPPPNVWAGVSVEDQVTADERLAVILQTPAAVLWVSAEPLLSSIDFGWFLYGQGRMGSPRLNWIVLGGESGPGARPCDLAWIRSIKDQCHAAGVACFIKQLGAHPYSYLKDAMFQMWRLEDYGQDPLRYFAKLKNKKGGNPLEWPADLRIREYPNV